MSGWFKNKHQHGERTVAEQLLGTEHTLNLQHVAGAWILDAGCAEGCIAVHCAKLNAAQVDACDINADLLRTAHTWCAATPTVKLYQHDLNNGAPWWMRKRYDIVLALAIVHKVHDPRRLLADLAQRAEWRLVLRLPNWHDKGRIHNKHGSTRIECDVPAIMAGQGFALSHQADGPRGEPVQHWTRI